MWKLVWYAVSGICALEAFAQYRTFNSFGCSSVLILGAVLCAIAPHMTGEE